MSNTTSGLDLQSFTDDEARKAEAVKRLQRHFGVDDVEVSVATNLGVQRRDAAWQNILDYLLQDIGRPAPPPEPVIEAYQGTKIHDIGLGLPRINFAAWTNLHGVEHPVCRGCGNFGHYQQIREFRTTLQRVRIAALSGCPLCTIVRQAVTHVVPENLRSDDCRLSCVHGRWSCDRPSSQQQAFSFNLFETGGRTYSLRALPGLDVATLIPGDTASAQSLALVQKWLHICDSRHQICRRESENALPKRVLDVSNGTVFLHESRNQHSRYICLSHCWGASHPRSLTTSKTIAQYKESIPWDHLPQNFKDAIDFCRRLQIQYLWIDSLCIMQDDEHDWQEQSAEMCNIYTNAYLTLAATKSPDAHGGCYSAASPDVEGREIIPYGVFVRKSWPHVPHTMLTLVGRQNERGPFPLLWRAWVCQERRLSRRMLHFTANELVWECREGTSCECSANPEHVSWEHLATPNHHSVYESWHGVIQEYSSLDLTYETDKLPALSGLAQRELSARLSDRYLAGLWESSLLDDLLWHVSGDEVDRPQEWRAPSWSWASTNSTISYSLCKPVTWIEVVEAICRPVGADPTGSLGSGFLKLKASLLRGSLVYDTSGRSPGSWKYTLHMDPFESRELKADYVLSCTGKDHVPPNAQVRVLVAGHTKGSRGGREFHAIVMRPVEAETDTFERIGWVTFFEDPDRVLAQLTVAEPQVLTFV